MMSTSLISPSPSSPALSSLSQPALIGHVAWLLVLIRKLHTQHAITNAQRGHLKEIVLSWEENETLLLAFHRFIENQDKEALVDALLELLPTEEEESNDEFTHHMQDMDPGDMESRAWNRVNQTLKQVRPPKPSSSRHRPSTSSTSRSRPTTARSIAETDTDSALDHGSSFISLPYDETKHLAQTIQILGFDKLGLDTLWDLFEEHAYYDGLNRTSFELVLSHLVIYARAGHRLTVTRTMYRIFDLLDREKQGVIDLAELVAGLALFCNGDKLHKLRFAFDMMDTENKNSLTQEQIFRFLYAFSSILSAFLHEYHHPMDMTSPTSSAKSHTTLSREIQDGVWNRAHRLFTMADMEMGETVNVKQFLNWSNSPTEILHTLVGHVWKS